jgi:5-formyltetrahydrofolate cyclo-ligase
MRSEDLPPLLGSEADTKASLRVHLGQARLSLSEQDRATQSQRVRERLGSLPWLVSARSVALYWPILTQGEVDIRALDRALRDRGTALYYPFIDRTGHGKRYGFRRVLDTRSLAPRGHSFAEPDPEAPEAKSGQLDLLVVPALGAARSGHRLGYGAGFYDTVLPRFRPPARAVIAVFDVQVLPEIPWTARDQACDLVITETRVLGPGLDG